MTTVATCCPVAPGGIVHVRLSDRPDADVSLVARPDAYVSVVARPCASATDVSPVRPVAPVAVVNR
ncbi:hypothetical protein GCM10009558_052510 [Virgisporangium aurantiacum]